MDQADLRGVVYMLTGTRHSAVFACSVWSLRQYWDGPITVFAGDEAAVKTANLVFAESFGSIVPFEPKRQKRNSGYAAKPGIPRMSTYDKTLQLDADTLVCGKLDELWPRNDSELVLTRYSDWVTTGSIMKSRIRGWEKFAPEMANPQLASPHPAINTGILSYGRNCDVARDKWPEMCGRNSKAFICDEIAMQLLAFSYPNIRILDDRFNWSPLNSNPKPDVRIMHAHGRKHCHPKSIPYWFPVFKSLYLKNYAKMQEWVPAGDKRLAAYLENNPI